MWMPNSLKLAYVIPLVKKIILEWILKDYRPVSNLAFLGKLIGKVSAITLVDHLVGNGLCEKMQSSYRELHSTETALMQVSNDILCALDKGHAVLLLLLDLSTTFDTLDHRILIERLSVFLSVWKCHSVWHSGLPDEEPSTDSEL